MKILLSLLSVFHKIVLWLFDHTEDVIESIGKSISEKAIGKAILKILPVLIVFLLIVEGIHRGISFFEEIISPEPPRPAIVVDSTAYKRLSESLAIAQEANRTLQQMSDQYLVTVNGLSADLSSRPTKAEFDSLKKKYSRVVEISQGQGTVTVEGSARLIDTTFSDDWITARIHPGSKILDYAFNFELKSVEISLQDKAGDERKVYSVYIRSLRDTAHVISIGNYFETVQRAPQPILDLSRFWIDPAFSLGILYGNVAEGGIFYSPWMISSGGREQLDVLLRYPSVGISSDLKTSIVASIGFDINISKLLPGPFTAVSISPDCGWDIKEQAFRILLGLKTRL